MARAKVAVAVIAQQQRQWRQLGGDCNSDSGSGGLFVVWIFCGVFSYTQSDSQGGIILYGSNKCT
jgi:hypothetical protein